MALPKMAVSLSKLEARAGPQALEMIQQPNLGKRTNCETTRTQAANCFAGRDTAPDGAPLTQE